MRDFSRPYRTKGAVSLDWPTITVGVLASALLATTVIRTSAPGQEAQFGTHIGGLRSLSPDETLILFEDDKAGWPMGGLNTDRPGLGAIWLADPGQPLMRDIALPQDTTRATLSFDLIALDDWAGRGVTIAIDGATILTHRFDAFGGGPDLAPTQQITLRATLAPTDTETRLAVAIAVDAPDTVVRLSINPDQAGTPAPNLAVDNLIVVAQTAF